MSSNPKPIERVVGGWDWWRDPKLAVLFNYHLIYGQDAEQLPEVGEMGVELFWRGFHPQAAVRLVMEGFADLAMRHGPEGYGTVEDWIAEFPTVRDYPRLR